MSPSTRLADVAMLVLSVVFGAGSIALFVLLPPVQYLRMQWPDAYVLAWDALLSLAFFVQHSGMVRRPVRARLAAIIPVRYHTRRTGGAAARALLNQWPNCGGSVGSPNQ